MPVSRFFLVNDQLITRDDMTPVEMTLIYQGAKAETVNSVQSFTMTDEYFVIASRPQGTNAQGGETNNKITVIKRSTLEDVTYKFAALDGFLELGHANGMTYNDRLHEIIVVGIRDESGSYRKVAHIDSRTFRHLYDTTLPCSVSGIAYDYSHNAYWGRSGNKLVYLNYDMSKVIAKYDTTTYMSKQDIEYYNGHVYLIQWASFGFGVLHEAAMLGLRRDENVIYRANTAGEIEEAFLISEPQDEMEGIVWDERTGATYVLVNGNGLDYRHFYIYQIDTDLEH